ncbi:unnamed protein product [Cyclocybe aegerita]|uniref:Hydrophobic surface binding protein n=1 Tax=Cyclocybe aegerita TaxID=1973307 RepID=A0A8S0W3F6_CYCAE|nr:unnamed protein product [Cyclocybe aegerita]
MVRIAAPAVFLLSVVSATFASPLKRAVADVLEDIADISARVTNLDNLITAYPLTGGTLLAALNIHNSAVALITSLQSATEERIATGPVGVEDGTTILNAVAATEPTIQHALVEIVVKRPAFQALPIGGLPALILQDLNNLKTSTAAFSNSLIDNGPAELEADGIALRDGILAGFDTAIAAYS